MSLRYGVLNFLLLIVITLLIHNNYEIWSQRRIPEPGKDAGKKGEEKSDALSRSRVTRKITLQESFMVIAEKNIFHPERKEFSLPSLEQAKPGARPPIQLYGIMITEDLQTASVAQSGKPLPKGEREIKTLKIGERIGEYTLTKILPDRVTFETAGDSFEILLYDPKSPKKRAVAKTPDKPAAITTTLPAPRIGPIPGPPPATPMPAPAPVFPRPREPAREQKIEADIPRTVPPAPVPDPTLLRGRRPVNQ